MNLSMKWLSDYVDIDVTPKQFSDDMTMSGSCLLYTSPSPRDS